MGKFTTEGRLAHTLTERTLDHEGQHLNPHDRSNRVSTPKTESLTKAQTFSDLSFQVIMLRYSLFLNVFMDGEETHNKFSTKDCLSLDSLEVSENGNNLKISYVLLIRNTTYPDNSVSRLDILFPGLHNSDIIGLVNKILQNYHQMYQSCTALTTSSAASNLIDSSVSI